jgi:hypothetical protein
MVDDMDVVLKHAQTVVIGNNGPEFRQVPARLRDDQYLVDFIRVVPGKARTENTTAFAGDGPIKPSPLQPRAAYCG